MTRTALVVEDSAVQRASQVAILRNLGFSTVLEAGHGLEALSLADEHPGRIELVLTDLDMPRMDGIELIRHLALRRLGCKLVVMSARDARLLSIVESMGIDPAVLTLLGTIAKPLRQPALEKLLQQAAPAAAGVPGAQQAFTPDELQQALAAGQFEPYFQPKVELASGQVAGTEALARWLHPRLGVLGPQRFQGLLNDGPQAAAFALEMLDKSLATLAAWHAQGLAHLKMSVNVSAALLEDAAFVARLVERVERRRIAPEQVIWEITECEALERHQPALPNLARLQLQGYGLAMDDYGTGYSSMQQLLRCPFTELKLDRSIAHGAARDPLRRTVLESAIALGRKMEATTVAEGIENLTDWLLLHQLGCDMVQGFMVARPMPGGALPAWLREHGGRLAALCRPGQGRPA